MPCKKINGGEYEEIIWNFTVMLSIAMLLTSCVTPKPNVTETTTAEFTREIDLSEYVVIRADKADAQTVSDVSELYKKLSDGCKTVKYSTDFTEAGEKEIIVGVTNRPESVPIRFNDYSISYVNNRIVINGGNTVAVKNAINWFLETVFSDLSQNFFRGSLFRR